MPRIVEKTVVKLNVPVSDESIRLSALDQQAQRSYAKFLLAFKLDNQVKPDGIIEHLKQGLSVALSERPDFASTVSPLVGSTRNELELRLTPESGVPLTVVNHVAHRPKQGFLETSSYTDLARCHFPFSDTLQQALLPPSPTNENPGLDGLPALLVQVNLIEGGLILAFAWHHTVSDAHAIDSLVTSWAGHTNTSITQGAPNLPGTLVEESKERWRLEFGLQSATLDDLHDYRIDRNVRSSSSVSPFHLLDREDPVATTAAASTWYFSTDSLKSLRSLLSNSDATDERSTQLTHSEAISALIWKHLSQARQLLQRASLQEKGRDQVKASTSLFSTRIDYRARARPPFHDDFIGNINEPNARVRIPLSEVCSPSCPTSLAIIAHSIRDAVATLDEKAVRTFVGVVDKLDAVTDLCSGYDSFPGSDMAVTDLSGLGILQKSWGGPLGEPTCVRSASRDKGLTYFLPQNKTGGFEVQLQCERHAVDRLRADKIFTRFAEFRC